ncbi:MAG: (Fe-S)-binding protein [Myxococcales bacterium]|nr:(Fe-S)-binding protein [Myxococcales bacterium]
MTALHHVDTGALPVHESYTATWFACTGCMACRESCEHKNEVAGALYAGRAEAVRLDVAPATATEVIAKHTEREARACERARQTFGSRLDTPARVRFVPGCTGCVTAPDDVRAAHALTEYLAGEPARVEAASCCGLPLLEAGDQEGFIASARRLAARLDGAERAVFHDPGCLHALRRVAPAFGVEVRTALVHITELAEAHLDRLPAPPEAREDTHRYHDPCRLGRGLGVYDAPRRVLAKVLGSPPAEFDHARERASCSGAGGQLPRTDPETADGIARTRVAEHDSLGAGTVVTACSSARRRLERAGANTVDFSSLVARAAGILPP